MGKRETTYEVDYGTLGKPQPFKRAEAVAYWCEVAVNPIRDFKPEQMGFAIANAVPDNYTTEELLALAIDILREGHKANHDSGMDRIYLQAKIETSLMSLRELKATDDQINALRLQIAEHAANRTGPAPAQ